MSSSSEVVVSAELAVVTVSDDAEEDGNADKVVGVPVADDAGVADAAEFSVLLMMPSLLLMDELKEKSYQ